MADDSPRLRLGVLGVVAFSLFSVLFGRLWYLQVMAAPQYKQVAKQNQVRTVQVPPVRGRILDRTGIVLADNRESIVVTVRRERITRLSDRQALFARLAPILERTPVQLEAQFTDRQYSPLLPLPLATIVKKSTAIYLKEHLDEFPGVAVEIEPERVYPYGSLGAHVVGYVGRLSADTAKNYAGQCTKDLTSATCYQLSDTVGIAGVEQVYERDLRGRPGYQKLEVDAQGRVVQVLQDLKPVPGNDVVLTIDARVQQLAEQALALKLKETAGRGPIDPKTKQPTGAHYSSPSGAVVVEDPSNGSILAMASYPSFDPRVFVPSISQADYNRLFNSPGSPAPLVNRVVAGEYAPASTFKLVTATAAVATGLKKPTDLWDDTTGVFDLNSLEQCTGQQCVFHNSQFQKNGKIDLTKALTVSSDTYFYDVGALFDIYRLPNGKGPAYGYPLQDEAKTLGFGQSTGIQLPDELDGRIPDDKVLAALHRQHPTAFPDGVWTTGQNMNVAIGQGLVAVTPLQLVNAYSAFANGGTLWSPNIVAEIDQNGTAGTPSYVVVRTVTPRPNSTVSLPPYVRDPILRGFEGVVADPAGTAYLAWKGFPLDQFQVAGKTGTAQDNTQLPQNDSSLFVGFGPVSSPKYAVLCVMDKSGFGADAAAPVVRRIFEGLPEVHVYPLDPVQPADPLGSTTAPTTRVTNTDQLLQPPPKNAGLND